MKVSELMIGDWVLFEPFKNDSTPKRVGGVDGGMVSINCLWEAPLYIRPIPLTADILAKNGFGDSSATNEKFFECGDFEIWIDFKEQGYWACIKNRVGELYFEGNKRYVHELQHALRLCGIDKEIVL